MPPSARPAPAGDLASIARLADLEAAAARLGMSPGWISRPQPIFWAEPRSSFVPAHWSYVQARAALTSAARFVDLSMAERRILALRNPFPENNFATTRTLSCSYQLMLPGEKAASHRHASHALRVMLDARGTYSVVDGVRMPMETGDVVLTPGGAWHGHGHDGDDPACWLDGLDIPLTHLLEPMYFEPHPDRYEAVRETAQVSPFRFAAEAIARRLDAARPDPNGRTGPCITLEAPSMPPLGLTVERLPAGEATRRRRSTASRCFVVMAGEGHSRVADRRLDWSRGDTIAVPTWSWFEHHAEADAQLFGLSDEPLMRFSGYWREQLA